MSVIENLLRLLGIGPQYMGYKYLIMAVEMALQCGVEHLQLTKVIYPQIAESFHTTSQCVERNMRRAIAGAWESGGKEPFCMIAGRPLKRCPSNKQLICMLAEQLSCAARDSRVELILVQLMTEE